ncbi:MAG TPA: NAD(P)/FAD-dependent oxidoreductase [Vicinamibacterales bacterium]
MREVLVVGAGPAGLSAGLALLRAGCAATIIEQHASPPPRVCGAFINPEGTRHLASLQVLEDVVAAGAVPVTAARVTSPNGREAVVPIVRGGLGGLAVPRPVLEQTLAEAFIRRGGAIRWNARATAARRVSVGWRLTWREQGSERELDGACLVVADGRYSSLSGRPRARPVAGWFGWNALFNGVPAAPGTLSLHFYRSGYVGVLTFADGSTNVCGLTCDRMVGATGWDEVYAAAIDRQRVLARLLSGARRVTPFRGVGPLPFSRAMWPSAGRVLAGDAAAVGDPYLGEGISRALGTGPALLPSLAAWADHPDADAIAASYSREWRARYRARLRLGGVSRAVLARPRLLSAVLALARPSVLRVLLSVAHR